MFQDLHLRQNFSTPCDDNLRRKSGIVSDHREMTENNLKHSTDYGYVRHILPQDKRGYQVNIFLISRQKHTLWVLIRSASLKTYVVGTH